MASRAVIASVVILAIMVTSVGVYDLAKQSQKVYANTDHTVTINETGLPSGMKWSAAVSGRHSYNVSASQSVSYQLKNGQYTIRPLAEYSSYTAQEVSVSVSGSNQSISVNFQPVAQSITALNVEFNYRGTTDGYFGTSTQTFSGGTYYAASAYQESFTLQSTAILFDHNISSITTTTSGFSVSSVSPSLPVTVSPGGSVTLVVSFNTPLKTFDGVLTVVITTY